MNIRNFSILRCVQNPESMPDNL